jgi:hypothetical protein
MALGKLSGSLVPWSGAIDGRLRIALLDHTPKMFARLPQITAHHPKQDLGLFGWKARDFQRGDPSPLSRNACDAVQHVLLRALDLFDCVRHAGILAQT